MANKYSKIIMPFEKGYKLQINGYYSFFKNKKNHKHILFLTYAVEEWASESPINLEALMNDFVTEFIDKSILPLQSSLVQWNRLTIKSIPTTATFQYNFGQTQGLHPDLTKIDEYFQFEFQLKSNKTTYLNLFGVPPTIEKTSYSDLLTSSELLLNPLYLVNSSIKLNLVGLKKDYSDEIISINSKSFKKTKKPNKKENK